MYETVIAYEGRTTTDGRLIELGALHWKNLPLPVFGFPGGFIGGIERVGSIVALRREYVLWGRAYIIATIDFEMTEGYCLSLDGDDATFVYDEVPGKMMATSMRVAAGTLIPIETWAWQ